MHDPKGSRYDWFEVICNSAVRGFSLVHDPEGSYYENPDEANLV